MAADIPLKVLRKQQALPPKRRLRRWRLWSLIGVHALIAGHLVHYWIAGRSLTPAVMSESMRTIELGQITCGVLMFGAAVLTSLVFGRFLCGWACHMGALQDLSAWLLRKAGLKPQPFRARWLTWAPAGLAFYLFAWPTLKREAVAPLLEKILPQAGAWLGPVAPRPDGLQLVLVTDDFWAGLPRWQVAVPFLLLCGVLSVVFLGARGVCRFVCPYGGVLDPAERLARVTVVVDADACDKCGLCTKVCDMGVRVMEETHALGGVRSSRCVRSLDCLAVCPKGALSLGVLRPPDASSPPLKLPPPTLTTKEELLVLGAGFSTLLAVRGAYDASPLLMTVCISVCVGVVIGWAVKLVHSNAMSAVGVTLKEKGRVRPAGWVVAGFAAASCAVVAHTASVRAVLWHAGRLDDQVVVSWDDALAGRASPQQRAAAENALAWYTRGMSAASGGFGLLDTPSVQPRMAWLNVVLGRLDRAEELLDASMAKMGYTDVGVTQRAVLTLARGDRSAALAYLQERLAQRTALVGTARMTAGLLIQEGRAAEARALLSGLVKQRPWDGTMRAAQADLWLQQGERDQGLAALRDAARLAPADAALLAHVLVVEVAIGDAQRAELLLEDAWKERPRAALAAARSAAGQIERGGANPEALYRWIARKNAVTKP